jgi:hypothetical protein
MAGPAADERERIRGYLQVQAAKLSPAELMAKVRTDAVILRDAASAAAAVDPLKRPAPDDWSVNEVLSHLFGSSRSVNEGMLRAALKGQQPGRLNDVIEATDTVRSPGAWVAALEAEREATFTQLAACGGTENLHITWHHPFFGQLNWREWLLFLRIHDGDHGRQVQQIVAALQS